MTTHLPDDENLPNHLGLLVLLSTGALKCHSILSIRSRLVASFNPLDFLTRANPAGEENGIVDERQRLAAGFIRRELLDGSVSILMAGIDDGLVAVLGSCWLGVDNLKYSIN